MEAKHRENEAALEKRIDDIENETQSKMKNKDDEIDRK